MDHRRQRTRMPRKPLREEEVPRRPVNVRDRCMSKRVERVEAVEACLDLQLAVEDLNAALRESPAGLGAEEGRTRIEPFTLRALVAQESHESRLETVGQEDVAGTPTLRDFGAKPDSDARLAPWQVDVADVQADNLR